MPWINTCAATVVCALLTTLPDAQAGQIEFVVMLDLVWLVEL
jgi:hypothetical protein